MKTYLCFFILTPFCSHTMHNSIQDIVLAQELANQKRRPSLEHPQPRTAQGEVAPLLMPTEGQPPLIMPAPSPVNPADNVNEVTFFTPSSGEVNLTISDESQIDQRIIKKKNTESPCNRHNTATCGIICCYCCITTLFAAFMFCYPLVNV